MKQEQALDAMKLGATVRGIDGFNQTRGRHDGEYFYRWNYKANQVVQRSRQGDWAKATSFELSQKFEIVLEMTESELNQEEVETMPTPQDVFSNFQEFCQDAVKRTQAASVPFPSDLTEVQFEKMKKHLSKPEFNKLQERVRLAKLPAAEIKAWYTQQVLAAQDQAIAVVALEVQQFCDHHGLSFSAGMGTWCFYFIVNGRETMFSSDGNQFVELVSPELHDKLWIDFGQYSLGSVVPRYTPVRPYSWFILSKPEVEYEDELGDELTILESGRLIKPRHAACGWVSQETAALVFETYQCDKEKGQDLLDCLPSWRSLA